MIDDITSYEELLEQVDEYTLYFHYLGFAPELDMDYRSPIRTGDLSPSWGIFRAKYRRNREFLWKDQGGTGEHGDVFKLVALLYGYTNRFQVLARIKGDFGLGQPISGERIIPPTISAPTPGRNVDIRVKSRVMSRLDTNWWKGWGVSREMLDLYKVTPIRYYFMFVDQANPRTPKDPAYAYLVMGRYKLYFPFERKGDRFRQDMTERELEGFQQLEYSSPLLIITKSLKDIMMLRGMGYEAVSPRGEHTPIPPEFITHFQSKYAHIVTLFDNDGKHRKDYPFPELHVPITSGQKDPTDFYKRYGAQETETMLKSLTDGYR